MIPAKKDQKPLTKADVLYFILGIAAFAVGSSIIRILSH